MDTLISSEDALVYRVSYIVLEGNLDISKIRKLPSGTSSKTLNSTEFLFFATVRSLYVYHTDRPRLLITCWRRAVRLRQLRLVGLGLACVTWHQSCCWPHTLWPRPCNGLSLGFDLINLNCISATSNHSKSNISHNIAHKLCS